MALAGLRHMRVSNLKNTKLKFSSLERRVNQLVWSIMGLNAIVLFVTFFMSFAWARERGFCPTAANSDPTPCRPWWYIGRFYNTDTFVRTGAVACHRPHMRHDADLDRLGVSAGLGGDAAGAGNADRAVGLQLD